MDTAFVAVASAVEEDVDSDLPKSDWLIVLLLLLIIWFMLIHMGLIVP